MPKKRSLVCGKPFTESEEMHFNKDAEHRQRVIQFETYDRRRRRWVEHA